MAVLTPGNLAPDFTLTNQNGDNVSLSDFAGQRVLVWFYPRAFGSNRTKQANGFRARAREFADANTVLVGITFSTPDELARWGAEIGLESLLLCDAERSVALRYGAAQDSLAPKAARISVLIDPAGIIVRVYEGFDAATHADDVLADLDGH